jgi:acyl transferase domain-containing protein
MSMAAVSSAVEPIAVVGVGCRFPGGDGVEGFWDLLVGGGSGIVEVPDDRWDVDEFFADDPDVPGRTYARQGGFVPGVREFDAGLFGVSGREAAALDPQHRLILETAWEALEGAGIAPDSLRGSGAGVFVGAGGSDYERLSVSGGVGAVDTYTATGGAANFAANRLSYVLGLEGPSLVVDTACSSSLVAVHLAVQSLRAGECDLALAGGVNAMLSVATMIALSKARMLSPSGLCKTFDAEADGYVRGEGCGIVILKRLSNAAGDKVLAVIRGSAVNQDGRSNGLTAPRGAAQESVMRRALHLAGVAPAEVGYVEAHGTGTALGDPIEVRALASVLGEGRPADRPVVVGSVKTNIGHLEAAAGIAGLIKTVLLLGRGVIPPHLNVNRLNPFVAWEKLPVRVGTELARWHDERRIAGVSAFGFGGTNAHVVLESPPAREHSGGQGGWPAVVKVSGHTPAALAAAAGGLAGTVRSLPGPAVAGVAWAAGVGRADLTERAAIVAGSPEELLDGLTRLADGADATDTMALGRLRAGGAPRIAFVVPGQGARLAGLLAELYGRVGAVTETVDSVAGIVGPVTALPLSTLVDPGPEAADALTDTAVAQIALYTAAVALGAWWRSVGVEPDAVVGHSVGAYAAAALAGVFSVTDGARLVAARARLMADLPGSGAMAAVMCGPDRLTGLLADEVEIAAHNSGTETVLSGPKEAVAKVIARLAGQGVRTVALRVSHAFHSAQMEPALPGLAAAFAATETRPPAIDFVSDRTGTLAGTELLDTGYWTGHTREPVRFADALRTLLAEGAGIVIELGTGGLLPLVAAAAGGSPVVCLPSGGAGEGSHRRLLGALARVWAEGGKVDWSVVNGPRPAVVPALPTYPFQRQTYWHGVEPPAPPALLPPREAPAASPQTGTETGDLELLPWLSRELADVMGHDLAGVDADTGLFDLGLTSAMVVELRARVERGLGRAIPATAVFDHPTVRKLAAYLSGIGSRTRQAPAAPEIRAREPIAIVGMSCRFPGGANGIDEFWDLLCDGRDATVEVPDARWDRDAFYDADPATPGTAHTKRGGFVTVSVDEFDAAAFGISPREARAMDPQQRLLLEVAAEALADAGVTTEQVAGVTTSVHVGINTSDYMQLLAAQGAESVDAYQATGNTFSVAAGRLSYVLGASGPSMAVDTACSSSLVATHLAMRGLRSGESDLAVVGGVNLMLAPATTVSLAKLGALSPDGRCKTFDASADGYGRAEGCGVVVLKRLSDAVADGDRVWAVLRGSAVNQDGRSAGLTVPNGQAQQDVIRAALRDAGVEPAAVGYVEAHGTGTPLGDPLEINALVEALHPDPGVPLRVGSVKTNIGHLEAAAGVSSLIKTALSLHHRKIVPQLHFDVPNPHLDWDSLPVEIPRTLMDWQTGGSRTAGVSSFGFSGTNAHVVLEEAPRVEPPPQSGPSEELLLLSARSEGALAATGTAYQEFLAADGGPMWADVTRTAALHRTHHQWRTAVVAGSAGDAAAALVRRGKTVHSGKIRPGRKLLFMFTGQGCQWPMMGATLLADRLAAPVLRRCHDIIRDLAGWSLLDELTGEGAGLARTEIAQPAVFAVQAALAEIWRGWGITPDAVLGHSVGEVAAAYAAGALDLDTAVNIVVRRGEVMAGTRGRGAMAAAGLPAGRVTELIEGTGLHIAAVNSPASTVVAGDPEQLAKLADAVKAQRGGWSVIQQEYAFHTPVMAQCEPGLAAALTSLATRPPEVAMFSTVTTKAIGPDELGIAYWCANMGAPVRFQDAVRAAASALASDGEHLVALEIGPHSVLGSAAATSLGGVVEDPAVLGSMRRGADSRKTMLSAAGALHVAGFNLDHEAVQPPGRRTSLPAYPWQRERYWLPERPVSRVTSAFSGPASGSAASASLSGPDPIGAELAEITYEIDWIDSEPPRGTTGRGGSWLLVADRQHIAERLARLLAQEGARAQVVAPGDIDVTDATALPTDLRGIVHLGALGTADVDSALADSSGPLLWAARTLSPADGQPAPRLWQVTRGGTAVGDSPVNLAHAPAWGLGRVVALEHADIWGGMLDLEPGTSDPDAEAALIVSEVLRSDGEDQVAYRAGARRVARLRTARPLPAPATFLPIGPDGTYLVTGGRGALGLRIAKWLADQGARHLVLTGRGPLPRDESDPVLVAINELRAGGVRVHTPAVDVADAGAMAAVFDAPDPGWPDLRGVVHAAGVFTQCPVRELDAEGLRTVLRSKVDGSMVLDRLAACADLDFFVMFSSASAVWGSALSGHYAAANHFQDALAHDRTRRGLPGLAVNWGWWAGSGMVAAGHAEYFDSMGLHVVPEQLGFAALGRLLAARHTQMTVAPVTWDRFRPVMEARRRRPLLELMGGETDTVSTVNKVLLDRLAESPPAVRHRLLEDRVQLEVCAVLGREDQPIDRDTGFFETGMDSITSMELKTRLEAALGVRLAATAAFENPTVASLAAYLSTELRLATPERMDAAGQGTTTTPDVLASQDELVELSEQDLIQLLNEELERE